MSQPIQDEGYVINLYDLSETSLIVHIFSKHNGIVRVVAKGAKSPKSAFAGCLELSNRIELTYQLARGSSDLHSLKEVKLEQQSQGTRSSYPRLLTISYFCALVDYWVNLESEDIYELFSRAINHVDQGELKWRAVTYFEEELSRLLGYSKRNEEVQKIYRSNKRAEELRQKVEKVLRQPS